MTVSQFAAPIRRITRFPTKVATKYLELVPEIRGSCVRWKKHEKCNTVRLILVHLQFNIHTSNFCSTNIIPAIRLQSKLYTGQLRRGRKVHTSMGVIANQSVSSISNRR